MINGLEVIMDDRVIQEDPGIPDGQSRKLLMEDRRYSIPVQE